MIFHLSAVAVLKLFGLLLWSCFVFHHHCIMEDFVRVVVGSIRPFYANLDDALEAERDGKVVILYEGDGIREAREGRAMAASDIQSRLAQNAWKRYMYEALCPLATQMPMIWMCIGMLELAGGARPNRIETCPLNGKRLFIDID